MEVLPVVGEKDEKWAAVIVACICLPMGTLMNAATGAAVVFDYRRMRRFKPTLLFLLAMICLNQIGILHLALQVWRLYGGGSWRWGALFCALNYGSFPVHQSSALILAVFVVVGLSSEQCRGLKYAVNAVIIIAMAMLAGLLNSLHSFTDYAFAPDETAPSPRLGSREAAVATCAPVLSASEPFWLLFATLLELLVFFLPTLTVALVFHCGEIRGNPSLPFASWATGAFIWAEWSVWTPKYFLLIGAFLSRTSPAFAFLAVYLPPFRLASFFWYLVAYSCLCPLIRLLLYIVLGHILLNGQELATTNAKYYDRRPPKIHYVHQMGAWS